MANEYCTLDSLKLYGALNQNAAGVTAPGRDDNLLPLMITNYSRAVDRHCHWSFYSETISNQILFYPSFVIDNNGWLIINTHKPNVQSVSALSYKTSSAASAVWTSVPANDIIVTPVPTNDTPPHQFSSWQIRVTNATVNWSQWRQGAYGVTPLWVQTTFVGGYSGTPEAIQEATIEWTWYQYKLRETVPTSVVSFPGMGVTVRPMQIPQHVQELLSEWVRTWQ